MPALALIAKDRSALSPSRSALARLLAEAEQLRRENEPIILQLQRLDEACAHRDQAQAHRDALLVTFERLVAESIALGAPRPEPSSSLADAEIALRQAASDERAVASLHNQLTTALQAAHEREAILQKESGALIAQIAVESALDFARERYAAAFRLMTKIAAVVDGVEQALIAQGQRQMQIGGDGSATMRACEHLVQALRRLRTDLARDTAPNLAPAHRLLAALATDPAAELEVE